VHVDAVCARASSHLHFLKILKRSSLSSDDLLHFYTAFIRPILDMYYPSVAGKFNASVKPALRSNRSGGTQFTTRPQVVGRRKLERCGGQEAC